MDEDEDLEIEVADLGYETIVLITYSFFFCCPLERANELVRS